MTEKKILLITYYFSPQQTPRAFRWEELIREFVKNGYKVDIFLPEYKKMDRPKISNVTYYETKRNLIYHFAYKYLGFKLENINNVSIPNKKLKLKRLAKIIYGFIGNRLLWPDESILWYFSNRKQLREIVGLNKYSCIISSSAPFTSHLLGYYIKRKFKNVRWIAEYSDPFSFNSSPIKSIFRFLNKAIERKLLKEVNYVVVPIEESKEGFLENFPLLNKKQIKIIPQSATMVHAEPGNIDLSLFQSNLINIVYAGVFYPDIRTPKTLLEALKQFKNMNISNYKKLRFHFFGDHRNVKNIFKKYQEILDDKVLVLYGPVKRSECAFAFQKSNYLLNISNISSYQLPSKLIEYLQFKKPIISFENKKSVKLDWPFLIKVDFNVIALIPFFKKLVNDEVSFNFNQYDKIIQQYSMKNIVKKYLRLLEG